MPRAQGTQGKKPIPHSPFPIPHPLRKLTWSKIMELTIDNVETVLDEMRPYLMSDGGNVEVVELDGPVVKLRLQGACGSCPSSTMTLRMGIERRLREMIPEIAEVEQVI
jgi:Fe-S cluster biogenesis protein NfuA